MNTTVTLDKAGRLVIPKMVRDKLHLDAGDALELEFEGQQMILRPARSASPLRKEQGVWVFRTGGKLSAATADQVLLDEREARDRENRGGRP
jgi:AbrB family looped-hinge helix DNA binding protein